MMEMQDVKERVGRRPEAPESPHNVQETDPMVPEAPEASELARGLRKAPRSWLTLVSERVWPAVFLTVASLGLHEAGFVHEVLRSPRANRPMVHLAFALSSVVVLLGSYIEVYRSMICGERVSYETARSSTHAMLFFMLLSGVCWTIGLWPIWHMLTLAYLFMAFWGVMVQLLVIFPPQVQRVLFGGAYVWFLYAYLREFTVV